MEPAEKTTSAKPRSVFIRLFGIFASFFGVPYLVQAKNMIIAGSQVRFSLFMLLLKLAVITLDFVVGMAAILIGAGLFLHKEWARQAWLTFLLLLLFVHFNMTVIFLLTGYSRVTGLYGWIAMVILVTIISWAYLTRASVRAVFQ